MGNGCYKSNAYSNKITNAELTPLTHHKKHKPRSLLPIAARITNKRIVDGKRQFTFEIVQLKEARSKSNDNHYEEFFEEANMAKEANLLQPKPKRYSSSIKGITPFHRNSTPSFNNNDEANPHEDQSNILTVKQKLEEPAKITAVTNIEAPIIIINKEEMKAPDSVPQTMPNSAEVSISHDNKYTDQDYPKEININEGAKPTDAMENTSKDIKITDLTDNNKAEANSSELSTGQISRGTKNSLSKVENSENSSMLSIDCSQV